MEPMFAKEQSYPDKYADIHWEQRGAEERGGDPQLGRDRSPEVSCEQNRAEYRRPWNHIQREAHQFSNAEREGEIDGIPEMIHGLNDRRDHQHMDYAVKKEEYYRKAAQNPDRPLLRL